MKVRKNIEVVSIYHVPTQLLFNMHGFMADGKGRPNRCAGDVVKGLVDLCMGDVSSCYTRKLNKKCINTTVIVKI
jgi:hypothetical protein